MQRELIQMHAVVSGRVQGVGMRWTITEIAKELGINGTVRNVANGTVEIHAQGTQEALGKLVERIKSNSRPAFVENVSITFSKPEKLFNSFSIVR